MYDLILRLICFFRCKEVKEAVQSFLSTVLFVDGVHKATD